MSLFQCENCGCCENTALSSQGFLWDTCFDWTGIEELRSLRLCSACGPTKYKDGSATEFGQWHDRFDRVFLPKGMFKTARNGNLEHKETGDQDFKKYAISKETDCD